MSVELELERAAEIGNQLLVQISRMREADPIYWSEKYQAWIVSGQKELTEILRGDLPVSTSRFQSLAVAAIPESDRPKRIPYTMSTIPDWIVNVDPPKHTRQRKLMIKAFSRPVAEGQRANARAKIKRMFDGVEGRDSVELVEEICRPIAGGMMLHLLGLGDDYLPKLQGWSAALNGAFGSHSPSVHDLETVEVALNEMRALFLDAIADRRENPREDFLTALVAARDADDELSENEVLGLLYVCMSAGHDSTMNTMALATAALAKHAPAREFVRRNPDKIMPVVMELSRFVGMSFMSMRSVKHDFEWRGHQLKEGQFIFVSFAGGNRDPEAFPDPERIDFDRPQDKNMTFGSGMHHCVGHLLAKMELSEFFPALLDRYEPELLDERLRFFPHTGFRGLESLHVRLTPRR